jgi:UPF0716 protein FxsA
MMVILALLICWPLAELYVAIQIADAIGVLYMLLLLIASWPLGALALRAEGSAAWRRLSDAVAAGRPPAREVLDGALVLIGGVLLIVPGFITDVLGALLLLPPTRKLMRGVLVRNMQRRFVVYATRVGRRPRGYDVESTATDLDPPELRR